MKATVIGSHTAAYLMKCKRLPTKGEYLMAESFEESLDGGKGSNQALALARLGAVSQLVTVVGDDVHGTRFHEYFRKENVNLQWSNTIKNGSTALGIAFLSEDGQIIGATAPGVLSSMDTSYVDAAKEAVEQSDVMLTQLEIPHKTAFYACTTAKKMGCMTILNPAPADGISLADIHSVDILTPNEPEAKILLGLSPDAELSIQELASRYIFQQIDNMRVVITLGKRGAAVIENGSLVIVPCPEVEAVDTSGAGDYFNAALAVALGKGKTLVTAVRFAVKVASLSVAKPQVWPSYPTIGEVYRYYGEDEIWR